MSSDDIWQDIYTGNEEAVKQAAEELKQKRSEKDDLFIADQLLERLEAIVQPGADWYNEPNVELNLYSPNEILTMVRNLERMIYYLESGAGY